MREWGLAGERQEVRVRGKLMCGAEPAANTQLKLVDEDRGPNPDDFLDQGAPFFLPQGRARREGGPGYTNEMGEFELSGEESETTSIDPVLKVYTDCDDGILVHCSHALPWPVRWGVSAAVPAQVAPHGPRPLHQQREDVQLWDAQPGDEDEGRGPRLHPLIHCPSSPFAALAFDRVASIS